MAIEKKLGVVPPSQGPLSSHCVESQRKANAQKALAEKSNNAKQNITKKNNSVGLSTVNRSSAGPSGGPRILTGPAGPNVDERLRLARERREESEKMLASREQGRMEREQRARRYYEQQLEERRRRLLEQRLKEEGRRAAVEEKRRQRQREEKERYESAVRKTLAKSQRLAHHLAQNSRGRLNKHSVASRHSPLTAWERNLVSRLLTPTCSYLARSRSAACLSGQEVSCHSMNTTPKNHPAIPKSSQQISSAHQSGPPARQTRPAATPSPGPGNSKPRSHSLPQSKAEKQHQLDRKSKTRSNAGSPPVNSSRAKSAPPKSNKTTSPTPIPRAPRRPIRRQSFSMPPELPSVPEEESPVVVPAPSNDALDGPAPIGHTLSPGNARPIILTERSPPGAPEVMKGPPEAISCSVSKQAPASVPSPPVAAGRPAGAWTPDREEALRVLAERRRVARLQREQEQQRERREEEEEESRGREEAKRRRAEQEELRRAEERSRQQAEEQARLHAEAQRLVEEKKRREDEEHRRAEEERAQAMREAALLLKKRQEEQAIEREKAEQVQREREEQAQKEDTERQARKKRLEEIMRRTRRTDAADTKLPAPARIAPTDTRPDNVGTGPVTRRPAQQDVTLMEDMVPVVAFKERRAIRTLTGLEEIQSHQRTEVI